MVHIIICRLLDHKLTARTNVRITLGGGELDAYVLDQEAEAALRVGAPRQGACMRLTSWLCRLLVGSADVILRSVGLRTANWGGLRPMSVRILDVREFTKPIASPIRNAYIDFSKMTTSLVAVVTDVGARRPAGRRLRLQLQRPLRPGRTDPRALRAAAAGSRSGQRCSIDRARTWIRTGSGHAMMANEKPGGHGERSVAVGTIDMAVWDAVAKIAGKPLFRLLAERHGRAARSARVRLCRRRLLLSRQGSRALRAEMRGYLDRGYTVVKMKIGGAPLDEDRERIEAVLAEIGGQAQARGGRQRPVRPRDGDRLREDAARTTTCSGTRKPATRSTSQLQAALAEFYPGPMATGENLFSHQDARNLLRYGGMRPDRDWLQFDCALSYGLCEYLRTLDGAASRRAGRRRAASRTAATRCRSTSPPGWAWAATRATRTCSSPTAAFPTACGWRTATSRCPTCPASASRASPTSYASCAGTLGFLSGNNGFAPALSAARCGCGKTGAGALLDRRTCGCSRTCTARRESAIRSSSVSTVT